MSKQTNDAAKPGDASDEVPAGSTIESSRPKRRYDAPKVSKKKSVARVTLFSGGGATAGGLTASG